MVVSQIVRKECRKVETREKQIIETTETNIKNAIDEFKKLTKKVNDLDSFFRNLKNHCNKKNINIRRKKIQGDDICIGKGGIGNEPIIGITKLLKNINRILQTPEFQNIKTAMTPPKSKFGRKRRSSKKRGVRRSRNKRSVRRSRNKRSVRRSRKKRSV